MDVLDITQLEALPDEALVARSHEGDRLCEDVLCARYKNVVRMSARPYFLMGADREDLLQEGMIGLYKAMRDYEPGHGASFRSFADMCITRQIISAVKSASRQKHVPLNTYISLFRPVRPEEPDRPLIDSMGVAAGDPEDALINKESYRAITGRLYAVLTPLERDVARLFLAGFSYQQISQKLGRGTKTVDNALQRVKRKMEKLLDEEEK